jgi:signal peptidase II
MPMGSAGRVFWPLAGLMVLADCSSKRAVEAISPGVGVSKPVVSDLLRFTLEYNTGAAFSTSFGPYQRWVLIGASILFLFIVLRHYRRITQMGRLATVGLALLAGGALGNLLDRIVSSRGVVDFIDVGVQTSRFYVFNIADAGITIGAAILGYALWRNGRNEEAHTS